MVVSSLTESPVEPPKPVCGYSNPNCSFIVCFRFLFYMLVLFSFLPCLFIFVFLFTFILSILCMSRLVYRLFPFLGSLVFILCQCIFCLLLFILCQCICVCCSASLSFHLSCFCKSIMCIVMVHYRIFPSMCSVRVAFILFDISIYLSNLSNLSIHLAIYLFIHLSVCI